MDPVRLSTTDEVEAALLDHCLLPPEPPPGLAAGATFDLRQAMARFSPPATHAPRRTSVVEAIADLDAFPFASEARVQTSAILGEFPPVNGVFDAAASVGVVVPVEALAAALGVSEPDLRDVRNDVRTVVEVVGRQQPSSPDSDNASTRLLERFGGHTPAGVAAVSLLYQTHDATAALFASVLLARHQNLIRGSALAGTTRVAAQATVIGSTSIPEGAVVAIDLDSAGFEFGVGPHACPGRSIAERMVEGMLAAIDATDLELCVDDIESKPDGRPKTLPMRRTGSQ